MNILEVKNLSKTFRSGNRETQALKSLNLTVEAGEFVAVMGASGSGKSTLLHLVAGLTLPDSGDIFINGNAVEQRSDAERTRFRRLHLGMIFQSFNLLPNLTVEENILLPLTAESAAAARAARPRLDVLLDKLGLAALRGATPGSLSGGEQQRTAIARALIAEPALVLADEPTGSLDSVNSQKVCALLKAVCKEMKKTVLLVTHEPFVACFADRVVVLRDGHTVSAFPVPKTPEALALRYQEAVKG